MLESDVKINCRWLVRRDLPEVLALQKKYCRQYLTEDEHISILRQRNNIGMVAEDPETFEIKAYIIYELHKQSLLITRFVTDIEDQDEFGNALLNKLFGKLSLERRRHIRIAVPEDDLELQLYFKERGFRCTHIEKGYYGYLDAYLMQFTLLPNGETLNAKTIS